MLNTGLKGRFWPIFFFKQRRRGTKDSCDSPTRCADVLALTAAKKRSIAAYDECVSTTTEATTRKSSAVQAQATPPRQQLRRQTGSSLGMFLIRSTISHVCSSFCFAAAGRNAHLPTGAGRVPHWRVDRSHADHGALQSSRTKVG
jgi:hypothetical protein